MTTIVNDDRNEIEDTGPIPGEVDFTNARPLNLNLFAMSKITKLLMMWVCVVIYALYEAVGSTSQLWDLGFSGANDLIITNYKYWLYPICGAIIWNAVHKKMSKCRRCECSGVEFIVESGPVQETDLSPRTKTGELDRRYNRIVQRSQEYTFTCKTCGGYHREHILID